MYFYKTQKYKIKTRTTIQPAAAFTYKDFVFKYVASFLYFCVSMERFCVFVSNSKQSIISLITMKQNKNYWQASFFTW